MGKVLATPYVLSVLLIKDPSRMKSITSLSDLIMQEKFAFGQVTPFLGSKAWNSLKLWFAMKNLGRKGLNNLINKRHELAEYFAKKLEKDDDFIVLNKVEINSLMFMYRRNIDLNDIEKLNLVNKRIHQLILKQGKFHLHQFGVPDSGIIKKGIILYPQRFMCGNLNTTKKDVDEIIKYIRRLGEQLTK